MSTQPQLSQLMGWDILRAGDIVRLRDPDTGLMLSIVGDESDAPSTQITTQILRKFVQMVCEVVPGILELNRPTELRHLAGIAERLDAPPGTAVAAINERLLEILEDSYGLHASLDILYVVDGYQITRTLDDEPVGETVHGPTLAAALDQLAAIPVPRRGNHSVRGRVLDEGVLMTPGKVLQEIQAFLRAHKQPAWADLIDRIGPDGITQRIEERAAALLAAQAANGMWVQLKEQLERANDTITQLGDEKSSLAMALSQHLWGDFGGWAFMEAVGAVLAHAEEAYAAAQGMHCEDIEAKGLWPEPVRRMRQLLPDAPVSDGQSEFEVREVNQEGDEEPFAMACGEREAALGEAKHYASQLENAVIYEVVRRKVT